MAINKNFVVKNGLEVNTNLILADADRNKVGIGSTTPRTELDVRGGIAATDLNITGVATIATLRATTGIVTNYDGVNLKVSGVGTIATFESTTSTITNLNATNLDVSGIGTIGVGVVTDLSGTSLNYSGIGTIATLVATSAQVSNLNATGVSTIASLSVTGSTFERLTVTDYSNLAGITTIDNATGTNLNFTGVGTFASIDINGGDLEVANLDATDINVTGISTLGTVQVSSGIITATSGIVTYYGDGAYLQNISAGIGIGSTGGLVGYGATFINFYGTGVSTAYYDGNTGIATIFFQGGGGGATVSIGTEAPTSPASGDLWYNNNEGRIFIYYDEVAEGIGSAQVWVDAAPFNVGIITALQNVTFSAGTVGAPSISFEGDSDTGFYSPAANQVGAAVAGSQVARFNPGGMTVTGVVTATTFEGDGSNLTNLPAGLGTALSSDNTSPLNKIYYTDQVLGVGTTITVDPPDTAIVAYTQYAEIRVDGDADFIVSDGDEFIPNILGIGTTGALPALGGSGGRVRADNFSSRSGTGAPTFNSGLNVTGVLTATTLDVTGNVSIAGTLTYEDVTNVDSIGIITARSGIDILSGGISAVGVITATSFVGDGSQLSGIVSGIEVLQAGSSVGTSITAINFASGTITGGSGFSTVTISASISTTSQSPSANTLITLDLDSAQHHDVYIPAGSISTITCTGGSVGDSHSVILINPSSVGTGVTVGFSTYFLFPSGSSPTLSNGASQVDLVSFVVKQVGIAGTQLLASAGLNYL